MDRRIVVPEGMYQAALKHQDSGIQCLAALEAALRWLSDELNKLNTHPNKLPWQAGYNTCLEDVRRTFIATEPEIPKELNDLIPPGHMACGKGLDDLLAEAYRRGLRKK